MAKINSFEELDVWQNAVDLCELIYIQTNDPGLHKDFALRDQIRKSAISIPSNISEGFERESTNQFIYFLIIAKGSCGELRTQLNIANRIGYIDAKKYDMLKEKCLTVSKQISSFIKYLRSVKIKAAPVSTP